MSDKPQGSWVNPYPHLHAGQTPPLHVDLIHPNGAHTPINVQNPLGAMAIRGAVFGPPKS
jgi:hypothetical protein